MGFKKNWDVADILSQIQTMSRECSSHYNDGYTSFECKKDLWQIKFFIDDALRRSPNFSGEDEWLEEQKKKRLIKHLKS